MHIIFSEDSGEYAALSESVLKSAAEMLGAGGKTQLEVNFIDREQMRALNLSARGADRATDVLSFPYLELCIDEELDITPSRFKNDIDPETGNVMLGEIYICPEILKEQAEEYGHSPRRECAYLVLHGFLHILGHDRQDENDRSKMRQAEESLLKSLNITRED